METTGRYFEQEYARRIQTLTSALSSLESDVSPEEQRGAWTVTERDTVTNRVYDLVESATDEAVVMTVEELLTDGLVDRLRAARARGVSIKLAGMAADVEDVLQDEVPGTEFSESLWVWSDAPAAGS